MPVPQPFTLHSQKLGTLPIINAFLTRMGVASKLEVYLPADDPRLKLAPAQVIGVLVRNIVAGHRPIYALGEWAAPYDPAVLGLASGEAQLLGDDRVGRMLARLFDADRASLITTTVLGVIREFGIQTTQLHNDSTTVTVTGTYPDADGHPRAGKPTPAIVHGHNKDYRPDLLQLLFILTISADGAVPIDYRVTDGNTPDDVTHVPTWDELAALVGTPGFLYVADSKLCSKEAMRHIHSHHGRFVTVVPHGRREDTWFRNWAQTHAPAWAEARRAPGPRQGDPDRIWRTFQAPAPSVDGYRVIWVHSSSKAARDASTRAVRGRGRPRRDRCRRGTPGQPEDPDQDPGSGRTSGHHSPIRRQRDQLGRVHHHRDRCFPLVTNDTVMTGAEVLAAYQYQPNLERRRHLFKGEQHVAPVYLQTAHRIEALLLCHFLAMLTEALIEREIRTQMSAQHLKGIALYPELRNCAAPSAPRILDIFGDIQRHHHHHHHHHLIDDDGRVAQTIQPELTPLQQQVLDLPAHPNQRLHLR